MSPYPSDSAFPDHRAERDRWVLDRRDPLARGRRRQLDPRRPYAFSIEDERLPSGEIAPAATIFLTNRECPWRCLMCDLWPNTLDDPVPPGAIPEQIDYALDRLPPARQIKLYNSGSFFDRHAIPPGDYSAIASRLQHFETVIVESHPALVGGDCLRFRDMLPARLEVAMGLETAHPTVLARLNKGMTLDDFAAAAKTLERNGIALRTFILVKPPFMNEVEAALWAERSLDFAFDCGAAAAVLIPTRGGNGAMEHLAQIGEFSPPRLALLEAATACGIRLGRGQVFADLWDLERFADCSECFAARKARLSAMNLSQGVPPPIECRKCAGRIE